MKTSLFKFKMNNYILAKAGNKCFFILQLKLEAIQKTSTLPDELPQASACGFDHEN